MGQGGCGGVEEGTRGVFNQASLLFISAGAGRRGGFLKAHLKSREEGRFALLAMKDVLVGGWGQTSPRPALLLLIPSVM